MRTGAIIQDRILRECRDQYGGGHAEQRLLDTTPFVQQVGIDRRNRSK